MPSPALTVMFAGSKRYPFASPIIFTSCVAPVIGAMVPPPAAGAAGAGAGDVGAGAAAALDVSVPTPAVSAALLLSPPAQAPRKTVLAASANPKKRILKNLRTGWIWLSVAGDIVASLVNLFTRGVESNT